MSEVLADTSPQGQTDAITEQVNVPKPVETPVIEKSFDDTLRDAVEKTVKEKPDPVKDEKPEAKAKPDPAAKPEVKAKPDQLRSNSGPTPVSGDTPEAETAPPEANKPAPRPTAYREPPSGFDDAAKAEWEAVPEPVRGAVHRRVQEMEQGIQKYRAVAQEFEPVKRFAEMAKESGTTLDAALGRYVGMEQKLRQDPLGGLEDVVGNLGLKKADGTPVTLRDVAASIMGQTPDQSASRQEATIQRLTQQLQQVTEQLGGFSKHVEQQQTQAKVATAEGEWGNFQRQYPQAAALEAPIAEFLTKYKTDDNMPISERLHDAYQWAVARNPNVAHTDATPLVQTQIEAKPTPNPAGQKSISGIGGGTQGARKMSSDDAMRLAISRFSQ